MKKSLILLMMLSLMMTGCFKKSPSGDVTQPDVIEVPVPTDPSIPDSPIGEPPIIETDPALEPTPTPEPPKPDVVEAPPSLEESFSFNVSYQNATSAQKAKYEKALVVVKKVIMDPEFKKRVLAHKYDGKPGFASSSSTPQQVYDKLLSGAEKLNGINDNQADLQIRFYYTNNSTIGYTYPNVSYVAVNTKFFNSYTPRSVAANFIHEYMHKLGYGHDSARTARRPYSVPYAIGSIMSSIGKKYE